MLSELQCFRKNGTYGMRYKLILKRFVTYDVIIRVYEVDAKFNLICFGLYLLHCTPRTSDDARITKLNILRVQRSWNILKHPLMQKLIAQIS